MTLENAAVNDPGYSDSIPSAFNQLYHRATTTTTTKNLRRFFLLARTELRVSVKDKSVIKIVHWDFLVGRKCEGKARLGI